MYRKFRNVPIFKDIPPICPYFLGFRVGKYAYCYIMNLVYNHDHTMSPNHAHSRRTSADKGMLCITTTHILLLPHTLPKERVCIIEGTWFLTQKKLENLILVSFLMNFLFR